MLTLNHKNEANDFKRPSGAPAERDMTFFNEAYEGHPPWDIGRPQRALLAAFDAGLVRGAVLDVGCGTGEHALYMAERGHRAVGIDFAERALETARAKAAYRQLLVPFVRCDALTLPWLGQQFDTVIDSGLFHVFSDEERRLYVANLEAVLRPGGTLLLLCFSERERSSMGPRRINAAELEESFAPFWCLETLEPARFETLLHDNGAHALLARLTYRGHHWPLARAA